MGGDLRRARPLLHPTSFNPRPRMGGDVWARVPASSYMRFNPRPRMGGDFFGGGRSATLGCFNPRPRMGRHTMQSIDCVGCFQSTPPYGGDVQDVLKLIDIYNVSIHAPYGGDDFYLKKLKGGMFQSTPPYGATVLGGGIFRSHSFNPRPRIGRRDDIIKYILAVAFQSTPRMGATE